MGKYPILTLPGYHTIPTLSFLQTLPPNSLSSQFFTISNEYGSLSFTEKVDLSHTNLDEIIEITPISITVYKGKSPKSGTGLNVPALVRLKAPKGKTLKCVKEMTVAQGVKFK